MLKIGLQFTSIKKEVIYLSVVIYYDGNDTYVNLIVINELTDIKIDDMIVKLLLNRKVEGKMIHRFDINPQKEIYIVVGNNIGKSIISNVLVY
jgi:hypothetical protein